MRFGNMVSSVMLALSIPIIPGDAVAQERLETGELRNRALRAYAQLPRVIGLEHAPLFSEALNHLFAYEQKLYRQRRNLDSGDMKILNWLHERFEDDLSHGKADAVATRHRSDHQLLEQGRDGVRRIKRGLRDGKIWDVKGYISASANLFTYLQVASSPSDAAHGDFQWLRDNRSRLVTAGGKADDFGPTDWIPVSPKPGGRPSATAHIPTVQTMTATLATASGHQRQVDSLQARLAAAEYEMQEMRERIRQLESSEHSLREQLAAARRALASQEASGESETLLLREARELLAAGRWKEARDAAADALRMNPELTPAYIVIARAYAEAAAESDRGRPLDRALYWLAADYLLRAQPHATEDEARHIARMLLEFERLAPTDRDKRLMGWIDGRPLYINYEPYGWIDETVVIR